MLTITEENILEAYRSALNCLKVDFLRIARDRNIDLYDKKTNSSLFF